jgi:6-pyruvoyltetrahydropterin/6-carboxytetrahydropterin synthase
MLKKGMVYSPEYGMIAFTVPLFDEFMRRAPYNGPMDIFKIFSIEAAHRLPQVPDGHKCARLHGHSFRIEVHVRGPIDATTGWVMDYADIKAAFAPLFEQLDHRYLNDIEGLDNPTSEVLARWIFRRLRPALPGVQRVVVHETCTAGAICTVDDL